MNNFHAPLLDFIHRMSNARAAVDEACPDIPEHLAYDLALNLIDRPCPAPPVQSSPPAPDPDDEWRNLLLE